MDHKACIEALNDLIKINNDRIIGYRKAIEELKDNENDDLKSLFNSMVTESKGYQTELSEMVQEYGGDVTDASTTGGKLYRGWMDVKAFFSGNDRKAILENCERGEDAAQKAYQEALDDDDVMQETKALISDQKQSLRRSHDKIRALRDVTV